MKTWFVSAILVFASSISYASSKGGWSAIAYDSSTGRYGYAAGTSDKQQAETSSMASCNSPNCEVVVTVHNGHAALVVANNGNFYGTGFAPSKFEALYWAMHHCNKGPSPCKALFSISAHD